MLVGGSGEPVELRAAIAWSTIPLIVSGVIYMVALGLAHESGGYSAVAASLCTAAKSMLRLGEVFFILGLWRLAICFACTAETQAFPLRQTVFVRALTAVIVVSALFALAIVMLAPAATSLSHTVAATALAA
jgi:hypothetical protein